MTSPWLGIFGLLAATTALTAWCADAAALPDGSLAVDAVLGRVRRQLGGYGSDEVADDDGYEVPARVAPPRGVPAVRQRVRNLDQLRTRPQASQRQVDYNNGQDGVPSSSRGSSIGSATRNNNQRAGTDSWQGSSLGARTSGTTIPDYLRTDLDRNSGGARTSGTTIPDYLRTDLNRAGDASSRSWGSGVDVNGDGLFGDNSGGGIFGSNRPSIIGSLISRIGQGVASTVRGVSTALANKWNTKVQAARGLASSLLNTGRTAVRSGMQAGMAHPRFAVDAIESVF